ncbi:MAG TPA: sugar phosphate nucleotidyltransferase, partial [Spirochaetota bacterium]|nr:sugar phosphate nucleotidyltransferase [Spirochaetota bacterium]
MDLQNVLKSTLVFILAGGQGERLYPLTKDRSKPSVHFAGIYRIIDFSLSNCLNSNLTRIIVLTQYKSLSLDRHIKTAWNLYFRESGNFIDVVPPQQRFDENWYMGTADAIFQNIYIIQHEKPTYVIILSGDHIYKMDYQKMLKYHIEKNADMTIAACEMPINEAHRFGVLETDSNLKVVGFEEKPQYPKPVPGTENAAFVSMGIYIFTTDKLVRYVSDDHKSDSSKDFGKDIIPKIYETENVFAYNYVANEGERAYWRDIGTIASYYEAHRDIISISPILNLYDKEWPIRTYMEQWPPAKFIHNEEGRRGIAINSLIANG